jgi:hypothetical protein
VSINRLPKRLLCRLQGRGGGAAHGAVGGHLAECRGAHHRRHRRRRGALQRPRVAGVPAGRQPQVRVLAGFRARTAQHLKCKLPPCGIYVLQRQRRVRSMVMHIWTPCRATLLADHEGDSHEEAAEVGASDLASAPDYQTVLDQVRPAAPLLALAWYRCQMVYRRK